MSWFDIGVLIGLIRLFQSTMNLVSEAFCLIIV